MKIATVLVFRGVTAFFSYIVENEIPIKVGSHVKIPFGKSIAEGLVISIQDDDKEDTAIYKLKSIINVNEKKPMLPTWLINLIIWFKDFYQTTPFKAYQTVIGNKKIRGGKELLINEEEIIEENYKLTAEQSSIISKLKKEKTRFAEFLVHGITASGKTEIYIQYAKEIIKKHKTVLILIPEIALTPQYSQIFRQRFGKRISVIHSGLSVKERDIEWNKIFNGMIDIVIGPRSAVFSPLDNLGLIIIDEEHESSYKQENHPRYLTHTVAKYRAQQSKAFLIYGSATPSIETYHDSHVFDEVRPSIEKLQLTKRVLDLPLPKVEIVDMKEEYIYNKKSLISNKLEKAIKKNIEKKEKTIVFINRRGYATSIICQKCGQVFCCPQCNLSYTYHHDKSFRCHRCYTKSPITNTCNKCRSKSLSFVGMGTQKIESELIKLFPQAVIYRLDKDEAYTHKKTEEILTGFRKDGDILIGTQMIAKGHHIDTVTLIGVLGVDSLLNIPDFRSPERIFQLLTQVAGRAGRGLKTGQVFIQTFQQEHYAINHSITHNYKAFYEEEIKYREELKYPPFSKLIYIIISSQDQRTLIKFAAGLYKNIEEKITCIDSHIQITEPGPAAFEKIQNFFRWQILIKTSKEKYLEVKELFENLPKPPKDIRLIIDFEPKSIL
ncbi:primosomal protein N' [Candidatus Margulisiibacteriota bacterium]